MFVLTAAPSRADVQTQHISDTSVRIGPLEPLWHFRVRTTPEGGGVAQVRTGPILTAELHERVALIGGYYFTRSKEEQTWTTIHRPFGGLEVALWNRALEVDFRSLVERFIAASAPDSARFRNRIRVSPASETAPYVSVEAFLDADGLTSMRYSFGVRHTMAKDLIVDFGYFYENRRPATGADRHMIATTFHWRNRNKRIDADP
jgi:hypothetical protein